ncbi:MAG: acetyl-CoA acetyltransferase [Actinobacteria bacterium]|nr:acetyl-CoA acetyltransferase [Actinomycetota bacterium]
MNLDPGAPVLVGAGAVSQRCDDPSEAVGAIELMAQAVDRAASDAGIPLRDVSWVGVPEGTWKYGDPGRLLAERYGWAGVHTVRADVGVTQQELIARACQAVSLGAGVAVVVGGEAKHRALQAAIAGVEAVDTIDGRAPDTLLAPASLGLHDLEIVHNTVVPSTTYAMIDNAIAHEAGLSRAQHSDLLARLWGDFASVAVDNPDAWDRSGPDGSTIVTPSDKNRMIAAPYTKLLCSQWNVDQAAALVICSVGKARALGVATDRWVFPRSSAVSNHSTPWPARWFVYESPAASVVARCALDQASCTVDDVEHLDLYSCFPAAVQAYAAALNVPLDRRLTVTGGMTFAGGPLNSYVVQAMVRLAHRLRETPSGLGLSSSVSGVLTKQGFGIWSGLPPRAGFRHTDCTGEVAAVDQAVAIVDSLEGTARIASWTVVHDRGQPAVAVAVVESDGEERTVVSTADADVVSAMLEGDWIGRPVRARTGDFTLDI